MTKFNKSLLLVSAVASIGLSSAFAYSPVMTSLDLGDRGTNVTNLQTFFSDNSVIYPEGLVTGYFGGLTQSAVKRFQASYNIVNSGTPSSTGYGRVGPSTQSKINNLISNGGWTGGNYQGNNGGNSAPHLYNVSQSVTSNSATFTWYTNENATAKIFYSTTPITINEGDVNSIGFGVVNGYTAFSNNYASTNQQVIISNLSSNTLYYYMLVSTDVEGNVSIMGTGNMFRTNN